MINTPLLPTGALRIAKATYDDYSWKYVNEYTCDSTKDINKNWWQKDIDQKRYKEMEIHYINPSEIVDIVEIHSRKEDANLPHHKGNTCQLDSTIIHLRSGEKIATDSDITREKIIECANEALKTGKVIDLIA